jgi:hypothetical protein
MATRPTRRETATPNGSCDGDIALLLERVCAKLPHDYTRQLVRDVVRMKLELGFEGDVRSYLKRRSGEHPAVPDPSGRPHGA